MNVSKRTKLFFGGTLALLTLVLWASRVRGQTVPNTLPGILPVAPALPAPQFTVDQTLAPRVKALPGIAGGPARPLARVVGPGNAQADFVENELMIATDDGATLQQFLTRWNGREVATIKPTIGGVAIGPGRWHLVRVEPSTADPASLAADLRAVVPNATGEHRASSAAGLRLLAAAAADVSRRGLPVMVNFVLEPTGLLDGQTSEAPYGPADWVADACAWPYMTAGSIQNISVCEAWRALAVADRLQNRVRIAVVDGGFQRYPDTPPGPIIDSINSVHVDSGRRLEPNPYCPEGDPCRWHGNNVVNAAMAIPDNGHGAAGPAGPIAEVVMVQDPAPDIFFLVNAVVNTFRLVAAAPQIVNISSAGAIPGILFPLVEPFNLFTLGLRTAGVLVFASAGNDGTDVDVRGCWELCEVTWWTPCENDGVICVGGLDWDAVDRDGSSNFGAEHEPAAGTVDIFAPYTVWVGPDPDDRVPEAGSSIAKKVSGTSFSSPFAAGVAALIWAANPRQSAGDVERTLIETANRGGPNSVVPRWVNAHAGVVRALGFTPPSNFSPSVAITWPGDGTTVALNQPTTLIASAVDQDDAAGCCELSWTVAPAGAAARPIGSGRAPSHRFATAGQHTVTVTARDRRGATSSATITVNAVNTPPVPVIANPAPSQEGGSATVVRGERVTLRGYATDRNEDGQLPCSVLTWSGTGAASLPPVTGCEAPATFVSAGEGTVTLTARDPQGEASTVSLRVQVVDQAGGGGPRATIDSPQNPAFGGPDYYPDDWPISLRGRASGGGTTGLSFEWTATSYRRDDVSVFAGPLVIGRGAMLTWTPSATPGLIDRVVCQSAREQTPGRNLTIGQRVDLTLTVTGGSGRTTVERVSIRVACVPG